MKKAIGYYYQKEVVEVEEISEKLTCVICKDGKYALKKCEDTQIEWVCHYIQSLHLDAFVPVFQTIENHYYFTYEKQNYYLMPWLDFEDEMVEELKLRNYFKRICQLHNETFYVSKIQEGYFAKEIENIRCTIQTRQQFYEQLMCESEQCDYKAPWHWQMINLYATIMQCLMQATNLVCDYENCVAEKKTCRLCFTYNRYDLNHYCYAKNLLVSIEGCNFNRPVSDIYAIYCQLQDYYLDFENVEAFYLKHFTLYDDEKLWLCMHLCLVPTFEKSDDAFKMCYYLEQVKRYVEMSMNVVKRLGFS